MASHNDLGKHGEALAVQFLKEKRYVIEALNWRFKKAEIDIIATKNNTLILLEVKTRSSDFMGKPEEFITPHKEALMFRCANEYIEQTDFQGEIRFDFLSIIYISDSNYKIQHFEDAFFN